MHLVLTKFPGAAAGAEGISLFVVPRYLLADDGAPEQPNNVVLAGLNHMMGYRGTVNKVPVPSAGVAFEHTDYGSHLE